MTILMSWIKRNLSRRRTLGVCCSVVAFGILWTSVSTLRADESERWTRAPRSPFVGIVKETCKSVVSIQGEKQYEVGKRAGSGRDAQYDVFNGMGTGVVVDDRGYILTNYHVVKGLLKLEVVTSDGERYRDVELIRNDPATDLAILKIKPKAPLKKIRMGRSERVELAEDVFAIGNPYGYHCSITRGIVSALGRPLEVNENLSYENVIQTDAAINPGNSGGPLINLDGEMIGLNAAVREEAENIAFAIPVDVVVEVAERMVRQTAAKMTHHGLKFRVVDSDMPEYPEDGNGEDCLIVDSVDAKSPAAAAGVKAGDVLLSSNGRPIHSSFDFTCSLIGLGLADVAELEYERNGEKVDAELAFSALAEKSDSFLASNNSRKTSRRGQARVTDASFKDGASSSKTKYSDSTTSEPFAEELESGDDEDVEDATFENDEEIAQTTEKSERTSRAVECVWNALGIEAVPADSDEYNRRFPNLQAVAIGEFNFAPSGGVSVTKVNQRGLFASGSVKLQEDDFIFGFGVGKEKEGQLSISSLDNLYYVSQRLDEFASVDSGKARVYLIRSGRPYFLEVDLNQALEK